MIGQQIAPGQAHIQREAFACNADIYDAWHTYQETRLRPATLRSYSCEVQAFLRMLQAPVTEYSQSDIWHYLDAYLKRCRFHQFLNNASSGIDSRCRKGADLDCCGQSRCPLFEVRKRETVGHHLKAIITLYDFLSRRGHVPYNYARDVNRDYQREQRGSRPHREWAPAVPEVHAIIDAAKKPNRRFLLVLLAKTGIRISEARSLRMDAEHFQPEAGWIKIPDDGGKRRGNRLLIIDRELQRELTRYGRWRRHKGDDPHLLVTQTGQPFSPSNTKGINGPIKEAARRAGLARWQECTPHIFRHFFSHETKSKGIDGFWWNTLRGDVPPGNEKTYVHPTPNQIQRQYLRYAPKLGL